MKEKRIKNMKKLATFALAALLGCTLLLGCACDRGDVPTTCRGTAPTAPPTRIPVEKVLTMGNTAAVSPVYTYFYDIMTGTSVERESDKAGTTRKCSFGGQEYELFYKRTRTFSLGGSRYYDYAAKREDADWCGDPYMERSPIGFHSSGALAYIDNNDFEPELKLEIVGEINADSLRKAVEKLLESELDFGKFERFKSDYAQFKHDSDSAYFGTRGYYDMCWFNEKDGEELPDKITARVTQKGKLIRINAADPAAEPMQLPEGFDFEPYLDAIERKARTFCRNNDRNTELEITGYMATTIGGSPYVWARVSVRFDSFSFPDDNYRNSAEFVVPIE